MQDSKEKLAENTAVKEHSQMRYAILREGHKCAVYRGRANARTNHRPVRAPHRSQTLCRRPGSSPQLTMLLPVGARRRHHQDQISRGRKNKQTKAEKQTLRELLHTHTHKGLQKKQARDNSLFTIP